MSTTLPASDTFTSESIRGFRPATQITPTDGVGSSQGECILSLGAEVELIGAFDGGFVNDVFLVRHRNATLQLSQLLYLVLDAIGPGSSVQDVAAEVSARYGKQVTEANILYLVERRLRPTGLVVGDPSKQPSGADEAQLAQQPPMPKADPLLGLRFRAPLIPARVVGPITTFFRPTFEPALVIAAVTSYLMLLYWAVILHGLGAGFQKIMMNPAAFLVVLAVMLVGAVFHEIGHATACRYGGAKPGAIGVGLYIFVPAFYSNVTDSYRLGRWGRVRTDLGGIYFNVLCSLVLGAAYAATGYEPFVLLIALQTFVILQQFIPFLRLDGYWLISDLTGVPDLFRRIGPAMRTIIDRRLHPRLAELRPWPRRVVIGWVAVTVPVLVWNIALFLRVYPAVVSTSVEALRYQSRQVSATLTGAEPVVVGIGGGLGVVFSAAPLVAVALTLSWFSYRFGRWISVKLSGGFIVRIGGALAFLGTILGAMWLVQP